ncbi:MAG: phosphate acyltransferase PlsX [Burkholderiaceae bacterium]|nr:MAG: phosphate acyltransferase PlsX [Burkholderiaceae bacterium]
MTQCRIAIDCMGGDHGLSVTVPAAVAFCQRTPDAHLVLVGDRTAIEAALKKQRNVPRAQLSVVHASEVVMMDDPIEHALRRKKDSSMRVAITQVKNGDAQAAVSAGNTGALMAISRSVLKTLDGVDRPAIATALPSSGGSSIVLDLGANVDCTPENLLQFAIMGSALSTAVTDKERPTVGLLNIGEEVIKGNEVVKRAAEYLRASPLNFYGNVEGNDIYKGTVDVVVCDGFVGNVALKASEGLAAMMLGFIKEEFKRNAVTKFVAFIALPILKRMGKRVDPRRYNGASLLGLRGIVVKSHGSADAFSFGFAIKRAYDMASHGVQENIAATLSAIQALHLENTPHLEEPPMQEQA